MFDEIPGPNRFMYNCLIRGYANCNEPLRALSLYAQMNRLGVTINEFTIPFVLKACACESGYYVGWIIHGQLVKLGIGSIICVQNAVVSFYALGGFVYDARKVFDEIPEKSLVSWNSMIGGYSKMGFCKEAILVFWEMIKAGFEPDKFTFMCLLSVSSQTSDYDLGRCIHSSIEITGKNNDLYVQNAIVDMYAKCGDLITAQAYFERMPHKSVVSWTSICNAYARKGLLERAKNLFEQMPEKNVVSWNSMISCCVQASLHKEALIFFGDMCRTEVSPDETTLIVTLTACSQYGDLVRGMKIHDYICNNNVKQSTDLLNALMDMYAKCGLLQHSLQIFIEIPEKNIVSYNVMIGAFALHGYGIKAIEVFGKMQSEGIKPDNITFTGLLSACTHSGFIDIGRYYFNRMVSLYGVTYEIEHYACMIDLLGRGGLLGEAIKLMQKMEMRPDIVIWGALLGACKVHCDYEIGKIILKHLLGLDTYNGGLYVLLANIFCEARRWEDVEKLRKMMKDHGIEKGDAISSIEIDGRVYEFMVDENNNNISVGLYVVLDHLTGHLKSMGYLHSFSD